MDRLNILSRLKSLFFIASIALMPACTKNRNKVMRPRAHSSKNYIRRNIRLPKVNRRLKPGYRKSEPLIQQHQEKPYITVWVHGTTNNPLFKYFHSGPAGLHAAKDLSSWYRMRSLASQISKQSPELYPFEQFYIYSWSGDLSFPAREKAAADLYAAITTLIAEYEQKYQQKPHVRMITHSHGGNVALNLARQVKNDELKINELILLACPVQQSTRGLINHPMFEKIYSIYSFVDMIQVLDPQGLYSPEETKISGEEQKQFFSRREFPDNPKLRQAAIRLHGRSPTHAEFIFTPLIWAIPLITAELDTIENDGPERVVINVKYW